MQNCQVAKNPAAFGGDDKRVFVCRPCMCTGLCGYDSNADHFHTM